MERAVERSMLLRFLRRKRERAVCCRSVIAGSDGSVPIGSADSVKLELKLSAVPPPSS